MAKIIKTSQAWHSVTEILATRNINVENPGDIAKTVRAKQEELKSAKLNATMKVDEEIQNLKNELEVIKKEYQEKLLAASELTNLRVEKYQTSIRFLQKEKGFFRKLINIFKVQKLRSSIQTLINKRKSYGIFIKEKFSVKADNLKMHEERREQSIEGEYKTIKTDISVLDNVLNSPEFKGAIAELGLIESLSKLPDNFIIVNDVKLVSSDSIYFDGEWLISAQIDHVVVSPAGVFVIEAKNWSKSFSENGDFFDPYQQLKRSSYLCRKFLHGRLKGATVKSIIAHNGNIPKKPDDSYAKVLHFNEVYGYIYWFKKNILTDEDIIDIANRLK